VVNRDVVALFEAEPIELIGREEDAVDEHPV
jgi:hypothetical protein